MTFPDDSNMTFYDDSNMTFYDDSKIVDYEIVDFYDQNTTVSVFS